MPLTTASSPNRARTLSTACSAQRRAAVDEVGRVGFVRRGKRAHADAEQAKAGAVGFALQQVARRGENASRELGRRRAAIGRGCGCGNRRS